MTRAISLLFVLPLPLPVSHCGKLVEILWDAGVDGFFAAGYVCKVSRTVGFALVRVRSVPDARRSGGVRFGL